MVGENIAFRDFDDGLSVLDAEENVFKSNFIDLVAGVLNSFVAADGGDHDVGEFLEVEGDFFGGSVGDLPVQINEGIVDNGN